MILRGPRVPFSRGIKTMKLKRTLLSTAVLTAMLGLAGCGSDSDPETPVISTPTLEFVDTLIGTKGLGNVSSHARRYDSTFTR